MNEPLISVVVPIYNVEQYLSRCVDSILRQTYKNLEVFLVDDGSPDCCGEICDQYMMIDNRVKVIHKQNGGLSDARNVAIDKASGEYIAFVDSDDYIADDYIEYLYELSLKNQADVSVVRNVNFFEGSIPDKVNNKEFQVQIFNKEQALLSLFYQRDFDTSAWGKLYRMSLFDKEIRYPFGLLYEDLPTTYRIFMKCNRVASSSYSGYYYLLRKNSIEGSSFKPIKFYSCIEVIRKLENELSNVNRKIQKAIKCRIESFAFHVLLEIPSIEKEYIQNLFNYIRKYRANVLFDKNARKKTRVACLMSYLGYKGVIVLRSYGISRKK